MKSSNEKISKTMSDAIRFMQAHQGKITRHPGGFWGGSVLNISVSFGTPTVQALVNRGLARYSRWQEGRGGRFPIEAELTAERNPES